MCSTCYLSSEVVLASHMAAGAAVVLDFWRWPAPKTMPAPALGPYRKGPSWFSGQSRHPSHRADVLNVGLDPAAERAAAGHAHGLNGRLRALFWRARRPPAPISSTTSPCDRARRSWRVVRATTSGGDRIMLDVLPQQRGSAGLAHGRGRGGVSSSFDGGLLQKPRGVRLLDHEGGSRRRNWSRRDFHAPL